MSVFHHKTRLIGIVFRVSLFLSLMLTITALWAAPASTISGNEDAICGIWYTNNNNSKVEIFRKDGMYFGKLIWLKDPSKAGYTDKLVILAMTYNQKRNLWESGTLYYPVKDAQYQGIIELFNKDTLSIRAFKGTPLIGKTVTWIRVK